jgi:S1-C subfamily serine protease
MGAGAMAGLAAAVAVVVLVAGVGLGHAVWPAQNTSTSASSPSTGSSGTSGGTTSPFGSGGTGSGSSGGSSTSPFGSGSGSTGNSSTGAGAPSDISAIAAKVDPALVDINTNLSYQDEQAAGTGQVLTSNGTILTNNHVIDGATTISVTDVGNGKTYNANVVGYDRTGDVAVIQLVNASGLQTISTASGSAVTGEAVVGIGNAGGTGGTPSTAGGSVTAVDQSITASDDGGGNSENLTGLIETNADIQPGDSGGSLVNASGQVIGMDTAASTGTGYTSSTAQGYAIPIATALSLAKQIEAGDASSTIHIGGTGFLGVSVADAGSSAGSSGGSSGGFGGFGGTGSGSGSGAGSGSTATAGAVVQSTLSGSPSAKAGLVEGDTITGLDGKTVSSADDLTNLMQAYHPGDTVQLTWTDANGQTQTASVTLTTGPPA